MRQTTISKSIEAIGIGLHKGLPVKLRLDPLDADSGVLFYREDLDLSIALSAQNVVDTKLATVIGNERAVISTIEHLMSAIYAYGIDNVKITLDADEVPIMDGSSLSYCMLLDEAGVSFLDAPKRVLVVKEAVSVEKDGSSVSLKPSKSTRFNYTIDFAHPSIKRQVFRFDFSKGGYIKEIARARTFGFLKEVEYLRSIGLAQGGSLENAIVLDDERVLNSDGLRFSDEFVRHKILDAIGDLSLLGYPILGEYNSFAGSHHLNHLLTKELQASAQSYEVVSLSELEQAKELKRAFA